MAMDLSYELVPAEEVEERSSDVTEQSVDISPSHAEHEEADDGGEDLERLVARAADEVLKRYDSTLRECRRLRGQCRRLETELVRTRGELATRDRQLATVKGVWQTVTNKLQRGERSGASGNENRDQGSSWWGNLLLLGGDHEEEPEIFWWKLLAVAQTVVTVSLICVLRG